MSPLSLSSLMTMRKPVKASKNLETESDARSYLFDLLARRDYPRVQLASKLAQRGCSETLAERVLDQFEADGYLSDQRFVASQVRQRIEQGQGRRKIEFELRQKGLSSELIDEVIGEAQIDAKQVALECYRRRYGDRPADEQKEQAKRMRHMAGRGFSFDEINHAIRYQLEDPDEF